MSQNGWGRVAFLPLVLVAAVAFLPLVLVAAVVVCAAWWRGWSPLRGRWVALGAVALGGGLALVSGFDPWTAYVTAWAGLLAGTPAAVVAVLPYAVALGVPAGVAWWARMWTKARSGEIRSPRRAGIWSNRQFQHAMRRARSEVQAQGLVPAVAGGHLVLGRAATVTEGAMEGLVPDDPRLMSIPMAQVDRHLVVVGEPGSGKTETLLRLARVWTEGAWLSHRLGGSDRPLTILLNCKGGREAGDQVTRFREIMGAVGIAPERIGVWPQSTRLDLWSLPVDRLHDVLWSMLTTTDEFYATVRDSLVGLVVRAPGGPPRSSVEFCERLTTDWLIDAWKRYPSELETIRENARWYASIRMQYLNLFRWSLGRCLDSGQPLTDMDALVATVEGTSSPRTAGAMAQALIELVTDLAARADGENRRRVLLIVDEYSAIADRVDLALLMERSRSLGVAVVPAAQSWSGLGRDDSERARILSAAAGGILLHATSDPERIAERGGTRIVVESGTKRLASGGWGDEGTGRAQRSMVVDPDWVRGLAQRPGSAVYLHGGRATWGVVARAEAHQVAGRKLREWMATDGRKAVEGNRIPLAELEAGLSAAEFLDQMAASDEIPGGDL